MPIQRHGILPASSIYLIALVPFVTKGKTPLKFTEVFIHVAINIVVMLYGVRKRPSVK